MRSFKIKQLSLSFAVTCLSWSAHAKLCDYIKEQCPTGGRSSSTPAYPSKSSSINLNPAAVPVEKGIGVETLVYDGDFDFSLVTGTGRVGAALSPSNSEETFFGPMGFEIAATYLLRKQEGRKYESQKMTLATGVSLWGNKKQGLKRVQFSLGVLGRYNEVSGSVLPGGGVNAILGPFTFGYSAGQDEYVVDLTSQGIPEKETFKYKTETVSAGIYLTSLALDMSRYSVYANGYDTMDVTLLTASLLLPRVILTAAARTENSDRPEYNFETKTLEEKRVKREYFGGLQLAGTETTLIGVFYNYYLLREISVGLTLFF